MFHSKRAFAALLIPLALLLTSCKSTNTVDVSSEGGVTMTMDMVDQEGMLNMLGMNCSDIGNALQSEIGSIGNNISASIQDIENGCRATVTAADAVDGKVLVDNGDSYTLNISGSEFGISANDISSLGAIDFSLTIGMPGSITKATDGGTVDGDHVTYTDYTTVINGISVTGYKSASAAARSNPIVWILIGLGIVLVIGGIVFGVTRSSKKKNLAPSYPGYPYPGYPYPQQPQPYPSGQYGQDPAAYGAYGQAPTPFGPYGQQPYNPYGQQPDAPYGQQPHYPYGQQAADQQTGTQPDGQQADGRQQTGTQPDGVANQNGTTEQDGTANQNGTANQPGSPS